MENGDSGEFGVSTNRESISTEIVEPDEAPVRFVRLCDDGEELAMIPWDDAVAISEAVESYEPE